MEARLIVIVLMLTLSTTAAVATSSTSVASAAETSQSCDTAVLHDAYRTQTAIDTVNETGEATSRVQNTKTRVEDVPGFVRLHAENPNGYCVAVTVEISDEIVAAADLGSIASNDESVDASWRAAQNLSSGVVYTRVEFVLPPGANATFSPSSVRVQSLSWTGQAKREGSGLFSSVRDWWGSAKLDKSRYEIEPTRNSSRITVPLTKDGERIEEWQATYSLDGEERVVTQDASEPVFYTASEDSVTFHFEDQSASVEFVAEPSPVDKISQSAGSYWRGLTSGKSWLEALPFATTSEVIA